MRYIVILSIFVSSFSGYLYLGPEDFDSDRIICEKNEFVARCQLEKDFFEERMRLLRKLDKKGITLFSESLKLKSTFDKELSRLKDVYQECSILERILKVVRSDLDKDYRTLLEVGISYETSLEQSILLKTRQFHLALIGYLNEQNSAGFFLSFAHFFKSLTDQEKIFLQIPFEYPFDFREFKGKTNFFNLVLFPLSQAFAIMDVFLFISENKPFLKIFLDNFFLLVHKMVNYHNFSKTYILNRLLVKGCDCQIKDEPGQFLNSEFIWKDCGHWMHKSCSKQKCKFRWCQEECVICNMATLDVALPCGHFFHRKCLYEWFSESLVSCPICRSSFSETEFEALSEYGIAGNMRKKRRMR